MARRDHIPELDGLRGIAVILVLWAHLGIQPAIPFADPELGRFGVFLFFALSGFLITRILLHNRENGISLWSFYARRSLRIFPAFYALLLLTWLVLGLDRNALYVATYTYNFSGERIGSLQHTWSLCVEEHFYLVWPILVTFLPAFVTRRVAIFAMVASIIGAVVFCGWAIRTGDPSLGEYAAERWTPFVGIGLMFGSLAAMYETVIRGTKVGLYLGLAVIAASMLMSDALHRLSVSLALNATLYAQILSGSGIAFGLMLIVLSKQLAFTGPLMTERWLVYVGKISYGLYLYHGLAYILVGVRTPIVGLSLAKSVLAIAVTFAIAHLSYTYFERPILDGRWPWTVGKGTTPPISHQAHSESPFGASIHSQPSPQSSQSSEPSASPAPSLQR